MSVGTPEKARAPAGSPPEEAHPGTRASSPTRAIWIVVVIAALVAGVAGGYLIRGTVTTTVTKTVTNTVTETVAPEAYTTSDPAHVRVAFDGTSCSYTGPAELRAGSTVEVRFSSTIEDAGWFIWWLDSGTTWEELIRTDARNPSSTPLGGGYLKAGSDGIFGGSSAWTRIRKGELLSIGCYAPGAGEVFPATMLRVLAA